MRLVLRLVAISALLCNLSATTAATPNIILLMGDDHGWEETGYNGHPHVKTPVLDEMAATGLAVRALLLGASELLADARQLSHRTPSEPLRHICSRLVVAARGNHASPTFCARPAIAAATLASGTSARSKPARPPTPARWDFTNGSRTTTSSSSIRRCPAMAARPRSSRAKAPRSLFARRFASSIALARRTARSSPSSGLARRTSRTAACPPIWRSTTICRRNIPTKRSV